MFPLKVSLKYYVYTILALNISTTVHPPGKEAGKSK